MVAAAPSAEQPCPNPAATAATHGSGQGSSARPPPSVQQHQHRAGAAQTHSPRLPAVPPPPPLQEQTATEAHHPRASQATCTVRQPDCAVAAAPTPSTASGSCLRAGERGAAAGAQGGWLQQQQQQQQPPSAHGGLSTMAPPLPSWHLPQGQVVPAAVAAPATQWHVPWQAEHTAPYAEWSVGASAAALRGVPGSGGSSSAAPFTPTVHSMAQPQLAGCMMHETEAGCTAGVGGLHLLQRVAADPQAALPGHREHQLTSSCQPWAAAAPDPGHPAYAAPPTPWLARGAAPPSVQLPGFDPPPALPGAMVTWQADHLGGGPYPPAATCAVPVSMPGAGCDAWGQGVTHPYAHASASSGALVPAPPCDSAPLAFGLPGTFGLAAPLVPSPVLLPQGPADGGCGSMAAPVVLPAVRRPDAAAAAGGFGAQPAHAHPASLYHHYTPGPALLHCCPPHAPDSHLLPQGLGPWLTQAWGGGAAVPRGPAVASRPGWGWGWGHHAMRTTGTRRLPMLRLGRRSRGRCLLLGTRHRPLRTQHPSCKRQGLARCRSWDSRKAVGPG
jgi:hypothetical protein